MSYRYGQYRDGPDPLAPPYDVRSALDKMGDSILSGSNPSHWEMVLFAFTIRPSGEIET